MVTDGSKRVNCSFTIVKCRCGGLVVNVMDSGSRGLGLRPGHVNVWDKTILLSECLSISTQEYMWVLANHQGSLVIS